MKRIFAAGFGPMLGACLATHVHANVNFCPDGCLALDQARNSAALSGQAASGGTGEQGKAAADAAMGEGRCAGVVTAQESGGESPGNVVLSPASAKPTPQAPSVENLTVADGGAKPPKVSPGAIYAGAAVLGGLQGLLTGSLAGAAAGAATGLVAAYLVNKGDPGAGFGVAAGSIVGGCFLGPVGGIVGGLVGGLVGHLLGTVFLS